LERVQPSESRKFLQVARQIGAGRERHDDSCLVGFAGGSRALLQTAVHFRKPRALRGGCGRERERGYNPQSHRGDRSRPPHCFLPSRLPSHHAQRKSKATANSSAAAKSMEKSYLDTANHPRNFAVMCQKRTRGAALPAARIPTTA